MYNVIFDMDGVIFDSERVQLDCWTEVGGRYGLDAALVRDAFIRCIGTNRNQSTAIFRSAFGHLLTEETIGRIWEESGVLFRAKTSCGHPPVKEGVTEILGYLKSRGIPVGIASSTRLQTVVGQITAAGLYDFFVGFIGGDAVTISKPNPEIYLLACREFGFAPGDTFAIEDSYNGIRAAHAAGMRPIMVPDMIPADAEMERLSETVCRNLTEATAYLKQF